MVDERRDAMGPGEPFLAALLGLAALEERLAPLLDEAPVLPPLPAEDPALLAILGLLAYRDRARQLPLADPTPTPLPSPPLRDLLR